MSLLTACKGSELNETEKSWAAYPFDCKVEFNPAVI